MAVLMHSHLCGRVQVGDKAEVVGFGAAVPTVVTGVEQFRRPLDVGEAGQNVGLLLRGVKADDVHRGMVLAAPGSITPRTRFRAEVYVLRADEGGIRPSSPGTSRSSSSAPPT